MKLMRCPRCTDPLKRVVRAGIGTYDCERGDGRAIGTAVLRKQADEHRYRALWMATHDAPVDGAACPSCARPMSRVAEGAVPAEIDVCRGCHLVWLDRGEDAALGRSETSPKRAPLPEAARRPLGEALAHQVRMRMDGDDDGAPTDMPGWQSTLSWLGLPVEAEHVAVQHPPFLTWTLAALLIGFGALDWSRLPLALLDAYFVMVFADNVEDALGTRRFAALLAFGAVCGGALHLGFDSTPLTLLLCCGAAASTCVVYYGFRFPRARLGFRWWHWVVGHGWIRFTAPWILLLWFGLHGVLAFTQATGETGDWGLAHLGGAIAGVLAFPVLRLVRP